MNSGNRLAILALARTPQAKAFGALAGISAVDLGKHAATAAIARAELTPDDIDEVVFGNVAGPPDAANIGRVIALAAGIPHDRIAHTVNRNCASGMESIISAWQSIRENRSQVVLAGGTESMSNIPMLARESLKQKLMRAGRAKSFWQKASAFSRLRPKDFQPILGIQLGLTDPSCGLNMGQTAEILAEEFAISRDDQDAFAVESHRKAVEASERCFMSGEIELLSSGGKELKLDVGPREGQSREKLAKLKPIFKRDGTVTPGNSCPLTDGAAALIVSSEQRALEHGQPVLGFVSDYAIAGCDPKRMGLGPVFATAKLLDQTKMRLSDFDLVELNEAFAAQVLACGKAFESQKFAQESLGRSKPLGTLDPEKLNVNGGAIALGHPVGSSGTRIVLTLLRALKEQGLKRGLATLCVGGGQGVAMMVEVA